MIPKQFLALIEKKRAELEQLQRQVMPVKGGAMAKAHFQDNFRKGGFVDRGLQKWAPAKRQKDGKKGAKANYRTLLSSRNHLFSSIEYRPGNGEVTIYNNVPYAAIHNEGGTINLPGRQQVLHFTGKGRFTSKNAKKAKYAQKANVGAHTVNMPKRQFIGESHELTEKIDKKFESEIRQILKS